MRTFLVSSGIGRVAKVHAESAFQALFLMTYGHKKQRLKRSGTPEHRKAGAHGSHGGICCEVKDSVVQTPTL